MSPAGKSEALGIAAWATAVAAILLTAALLASGLLPLDAWEAAPGRALRWRIPWIRASVAGLLFLGQVIIVFAVLGYLLGWAWTGLIPYDLTPHAGDIHRQPGKTAWDWLQLLIVPLVLAVGGTVVNSQLQAQRDRLEEARRQESDLEAYFDHMSDLLLKQQLATNIVAQYLGNARTRSVLERLNGYRRGVVVRFLYDSQLVDKMHPIISLERCNLSDVCLSDAMLPAIDLHGARMSNAVLSNATLHHADLSEAILNDADMTSANLLTANLMGANLQRAKLIRTNLYYADLYYADLSGCNAEGVDLRKANLRNAVLLRANLTGAKVILDKLTPDLSEEQRSVIQSITPEESVMRERVWGNDEWDDKWRARVSIACERMRRGDPRRDEIERLGRDLCSKYGTWILQVIAKIGDAPDTDERDRLFDSVVDKSARVCCGWVKDEDLLVIDKVMRLVIETVLAAK